VIPENLAEQFDDEKIKMIIAHELAHHKRRDLWWCWLPTISRIVFFFNPLVWVALKKWNIAKEMACDELVLNVTNFSPATYAEVLVNIASKAIRSRLMASPASISMIQSSSLKRRLLAMSHITNPGRFSTRSISLFLLILLTAMVGSLLKNWLLPKKLNPRPLLKRQQKN
jgi:beta-lactamase regulating signal transducer with metallopeptidase domain